MITWNEFLSSVWAQALGWTLIHSIWQSLVIFLVVLSILRFTPTRFSATRYALSLGGLGAICLTSVITFVFIFNGLNERALPSTEIVYTAHLVTTSPIPEIKTGPVTVLSFLQLNMHYVVAAWLFGTIIFLLRTAGGWLYISTLKKESITINGEWEQTLNALGYKVGIKRWVELATSAKISAPVVFGYFKPIVLVPASMFTGLTPAQVETVFLHELMHIKRDDYLINFIQLFIDSIFFFNPFVWLISSIVRREREHCCDDAVVAHHANSSDYAHALAKLEAVRLQHVTLALSLSGNKNYLLSRIKRIMENSVKNYSVRDRIIPVALLLIGLLCASWLTIQPEKENGLLAINDKILQPSQSFNPLADTTKKKKNARYTRKKIVTLGEDGKPQEEIVEEFEGDEELNPLVPLGNLDLIVDYVFPAPPADFESFDESFDIQFPISPMNPMHFSFNMDSVPEFSSEWSVAFSEEFEKAFEERFSEFYQLHQEEINLMMQDLNEKFDQDFELNFDDKKIAEHLESQMQEAEEHIRRNHEHLREQQEDKNSEFHLKKIEEAHLKAEQAQKRVHENMDRANERQQRALELQQQHMFNREENMKLQEQNQKIMEQKMKADEKALNEFQLALREELVKDGYLTKNEKINNLQWNDTDGKGAGSMEVNGKKIKDGDRKKYQELHNKFMKNRTLDFYITE